MGNEQTNFEKCVHFTDGKISADVTVSLKNGRLSICGTTYSGTKLLKNEKNCIASGQCIDEAAPILPEQFVEIWDRWHMNDMRAGTVAQTEALHHFKKTLRNLDGDEALAYLSSFGIVTDENRERMTSYVNWKLHKSRLSGVTYEMACQYLSFCGLLVENEYKYGQAWLNEPLPADVVEYLERLQ